VDDALLHSSFFSDFGLPFSSFSSSQEQGFDTSTNFAGDMSVTVTGVPRSRWHERRDRRRFDHVQPFVDPDAFQE